MIDIPHDEGLAQMPSWSKSIGWVSVRCGNTACGRRATLRDAPNAKVRKDGTKGHDIADDGTVTPSIVCPYCGEGWHVWGRLLDWTP